MTDYIADYYNETLGGVLQNPFSPFTDAGLPGILPKFASQQPILFPTSTTQIHDVMGWIGNQAASTLDLYPGYGDMSGWDCSRQFYDCPIFFTRANNASFPLAANAIAGSLWLCQDPLYANADYSGFGSGNTYNGFYRCADDNSHWENSGPKIRTGSGAPVNATGKDGDFYIDTATTYAYYTVNAIEHDWKTGQVVNAPLDGDLGYYRVYGPKLPSYLVEAGEYKQWEPPCFPVGFGGTSRGLGGGYGNTRTNIKARYIKVQDPRFYDSDSSTYKWPTFVLPVNARGWTTFFTATIGDTSLTGYPDSPAGIAQIAARKAFFKIPLCIPISAVTMTGVPGV